MKVWGFDEAKALRRQYSRTSDAELARIFSCNESDIASKAAELAISKDKRSFKGRPMPRWTEEQIEELRRDYTHTRNVDLARRFGRSVKSVNSKAHGLGLRKDPARLVNMGRENVAKRRDRTER